MIPVYVITANGKPITNLIGPILNSLTVTDETGEQADRLTIRLDDTAGTLELPKRGAILTLQLGIGLSLVDFGQFTVNTVTAGGPPDILQIDAHAVPMAGAGKAQQRKSRSWDGKTLGDIVSTIAGEHGLEAVVSTGLADIDPGHLDQTDESDISFLARLARDYGAATKATAGKLAFILRGASRAASGAKLGTVALVRSDLSRWSATFSDVGGYKSVVAAYRNLATAQTTDVVVGEGEPVFRLPHVYSTESNARRAAKARLDDMKRGAGGRVQLTMPARLDIIAETPLTLSGVRQGVDGAYVARRVEHTLDKSGLRTTVDGERAV